MKGVEIVLLQNVMYYIVLVSKPVSRPKFKISSKSFSLSLSKNHPQNPNQNPKSQNEQASLEEGPVNISFQFNIALNNLEKEQ